MNKQTDVDENTDKCPPHSPSMKMASSDRKKKEKKYKKEQEEENENKVCQLEAENERTIFVGNLPQYIKKKRLHKIFCQYGGLETIRLRSAAVANPETSKKVAVIKKIFHPKRTNINAYIRFKTAESAQTSLEANGLLVDKHHVRVDLATASVRDTECQKRAIFIGNLPFDAAEEDLRNQFQGCGKIIDVRIIRDNKTGIGKGFAYINFESIDSVELALKLNGVKLDNRELRIFRAVTKKKVDKLAHKKMLDRGKKGFQSQRVGSTTMGNKKEHHFLKGGKKMLENKDIEQGQSSEKRQASRRQPEKYFQGERSDESERKNIQGKRVGSDVGNKKFLARGKYFHGEEKRSGSSQSGGRKKGSRSQPEKYFQGERTDGSGKVRKKKKKAKLNKNTLKKVVIAKKLQQ